MPWFACWVPPCAAAIFCPFARAQEARKLTPRFITNVSATFKRCLQDASCLQRCYARKPALPEPGSHVEKNADEHSCEVKSSALQCLYFSRHLRHCS